MLEEEAHSHKERSTTLFQHEPRMSGHTTNELTAFQGIQPVSHRKDSEPRLSATSTTSNTSSTNTIPASASISMP